MASGHLKVPHLKAGQMAAPTSTASPSKIPLPTGSRPQMATFARSRRPSRRSALRPSPDVQMGSSPLPRFRSALSPTPDVLAAGLAGQKMTQLRHLPCLPSHQLWPQEVVNRAISQVLRPNAETTKMDEPPIHAVGTQQQVGIFGDPFPQYRVDHHKVTID